MQSMVKSLKIMGNWLNASFSRVRFPNIRNSVPLLRMLPSIIINLAYHAQKIDGGDEVARHVFWGFPKMGNPQFAGWFIMENRTKFYKWMMTGGTPILGNLHIPTQKKISCHPPSGPSALPLVPLPLRWRQPWKSLGNPSEKYEPQLGWLLSIDG